MSIKFTGSGGSMKFTGSGPGMKATTLGGGGGGNNALVSVSWAVTGGGGSYSFNLGAATFSPIFTNVAGRTIYYVADASLRGPIPAGTLAVGGWLSNAWGSDSFDVQVFNTATNANTAVGTGYGAVGNPDPEAISIPGGVGNLIIVDARAGGNSAGYQLFLLGDDLAAGLGLP